jgi:hypothetical protein
VLLAALAGARQPATAASWSQPSSCRPPGQAPRLGLLEGEVRGHLHRVLHQLAGLDGRPGRSCCPCLRLLLLRPRHCELLVLLLAWFALGRSQEVARICKRVVVILVVAIVPKRVDVLVPACSSRSRLVWRMPRERPGVLPGLYKPAHVGAVEPCMCHASGNQSQRGARRPASATRGEGPLRRGTAARLFPHLASAKGNSSNASPSSCFKCMAAASSRRVVNDPLQQEEGQRHGVSGVTSGVFWSAAAASGRPRHLRQPGELARGAARRMPRAPLADSRGCAATGASPASLNCYQRCKPASSPPRRARPTRSATCVG